MNHHPVLGRILLVIVVAHAILYLAFSSQLCGFDTANLYRCRRLFHMPPSRTHVLGLAC